jgi:hypothetical protein
MTTQSTSPAIATTIPADAPSEDGNNRTFIVTDQSTGAERIVQGNSKGAVLSYVNTIKVQLADADKVVALVLKGIAIEQAPFVAPSARELKTKQAALQPRSGTA